MDDFELTNKINELVEEKMKPLVHKIQMLERQNLQLLALVNIINNKEKRHEKNINFNFNNGDGNSHV